MRTHDVPYMEALRRVTSQATSANDAQMSVSGRPLNEPLILGYTPSKPSLGEEPTPAPYVVGGEGENWPRLVTVYGTPGTGKTMFLRSILKQFQGHCAYIVHDGFLLDGPSLPGGKKNEGIEPWAGLTDINLQPWMTGFRAPRDLDAPGPPSINDLPFGSLVIFDLGGAGRLLGPDGDSYYERKIKDALLPWVEFEAELGRRARGKGIVVTTSVMTDDGPEARMPLSLLGSPLSEASTKVRRMSEEDEFTRRHPGDPWVYEVTSLDPHSPNEHLLLTKGEARRVAPLPHSEVGAEGV